MMLLSQVAQALGGTLIGPDVRFNAVSTDSRTIAPGDLFVALKGDNFDGSDFIEAAFQSGAVAALLDEGQGSKFKSQGSPLAPFPLLSVSGTARLALGRLAAYWRAQFTLPVVAVTGSNGKTTVKEMLASILREAVGNADAVLATQGNFNNDIGMPLTLLKLRAAHRYAVIEMGMNHTGEIDYLTRLARPDVVIVNNASGAHLAGLGSVEAVARAKGEIFAGLMENGAAIINSDDDFASLWRGMAGKHKLIDFGLEQSAKIHAQWQVQGYGSRIQVSTPEGDFSASLQVPGLHNVRNALAATAAAVALNIPMQTIATGLENFTGVAGRLQRKTGLHGAVVIDDTYNANPASLSSAIKVLMQGEGKKILVLGDMGELGSDAAHLHAGIGAEALHLGVNELLALGELSLHAVREFGKGAKHFLNIEDLYAALDNEMGPDSTVLVKGSRFMKMERVVKYCTSEALQVKPADCAAAAPAHKDHATPACSGNEEKKTCFSH
jgi:UDP-N-acetylmuramoyl-tripeptide--D-alanyl-D-alanine ligase